MAITRNNQSEDPSNDGISDYEKLRLEKIKRNEDRMKELGLFRTKDAIAASAKKRKAKKIAQTSPDLPQRRSSRQRKTVVDYSEEQVIPMYEDDEEKAKAEESYSDDESTSNDEEDIEEDDYEVSENEDDEEEEIEEPPKKRSKPNKVPSSTSQSSSKSAAVDIPFICINAKGGLTLEYAKTGRSSCRKCRDKIEKGKPRVGMEAWIVGRNAMTWQHPICMLKNMCCLYEKSNGGKGKCKVSHIPFVKGQLKIGVRSHTATSYYRIEAIEGVLANLVALLRTESGKEDFELKVDGIDGSEKLTSEDRTKIACILETVFQNKETAPESPLLDEPKSEPAVDKASKAKSKTKSQKTKSREQPKVGTKSGAKGKVEWKFGGRKCFGTLIPRMETKTHCYARTHKGNVKTLAKGKDYWSVAE